MKYLKLSTKEIDEKFNKIEKYNRDKGVNGLPIKFLNDIKEHLKKDISSLNINLQVIHFIILLDNIELLKLLLNMGLNLNPLENDDLSLISRLVMVNQKNFKQFLLEGYEFQEYEFNLDTNALEKLYKDSDKKRKETIELLLHYGADINFNAMSIFIICMTGNIESIEFLLNKGLNPNISIENKPLILSLLIMNENLFEEFNHENQDISFVYKDFNERRYEIIERLVHYGADINFKIDNIPFLYYFFIDFSKEKVESILEEEYLKVIKQMITGSLENLEFLLKNGLNVNEEFKGSYPLIVAVKENKRKIVELLLLYGADVNKKDNKGNTALSLVSKKRDIDMMKLLISYGANVHEIILRTPLGKSGKGLDASSFLNSSLEKIATEENLNKEDFLLNETEKINYNYLNSESILEIIYEDQLSTISTLITEELSFEKIKDILNVENFPKENLKQTVYLMDYFIEKIKNQEAIFSQFEHISLVKAYLNKKEEALQLLIDSGFDINHILNAFGNTLFLEACRDNDIKTVQFCIRNGANVHIKNRIGQNGFNLTTNIEIKKILNEQKIDREIIVNENELFRVSLISEVRIKSFQKDKKEVKDKESEQDVKNEKNLIENIEIITPFMKILKEKDTEALLKYMKRIKKPREINIYLLIKDNYQIDFIEPFLKSNKLLVNEIDQYSQYTPLMLAVEKDDFNIVKLLLKYDAKVTLSTKKGEALNFVKSNKIENLLWEYYKPMQTHQPKQLVKLLTNFTIDTPIKYTTHLWDFGDIKKEYGSFKEFIDAISKQWREIETELKDLSPNLHNKIYNFLLNTNPTNWSSKTNIPIGWASLEGLEKWCDEGNNPFEFKLKEHYEVDNKTITTFSEVINLFKREIEIRNENNMLERIFLEYQKKLGRKFNVKLIKLKGRTFYTDVEKLQLSIGRIFEEIKKRDDKEISIEVFEPNAEFIELKITQLNSSANRNAQEMIEEVESGDFKILKENLTNLCDWSIESTHEKESYRVNYLKASETLDIEELSTVNGFSHILRFYKK